MPLRKLGIGTYVAASPNASTMNSAENVKERNEENPYYPIATATMDTRVFDVVHMFSERGISAVPIIDDKGVVVNLYETVDVMVSTQSHNTTTLSFTLVVDFGPTWSVSITRPYNCCSIK